MEKEGFGLDITELRLGLPGGADRNEKKRVFSEIEGGGKDGRKVSSATQDKKSSEVVVGWPPVCSYRRKNSFNEEKDINNGGKLYVKVSMDGAPFLRKMDLTSHRDYSDLLHAFDRLFDCFGIGEVLEDADNSEYVPIYEDKDGDWMLLGDVPWDMFVESCKRLRIMKRSEALGLELHPKNYLRLKTNDDD
ncbi:auxin-induced protein IAA6-like [Malania oleifera]|uniref:auxin-induced protein IAA6-like n=1 Tax=Malania oleifera TaxID=397392 RepID=UPI0025AE5963|nr:auxin-induced protein IAA6-like [Malania oleifera]